ncbi:MAG: N-acetylmuramoyl-L-alanine amidase [Flavobacteriales bacterium]
MKRFLALFLLSIIVPLFGFVGSDDDVNAVRKIIIDAGHGGRDPGNLGTGRYKSKEKHITLKVARLLGKYIEENLNDVEIIYTREGDTYPKLYERTALANSEKADLFISIHCDAFTKSSVKGSSSFVRGTTISDKNRRVVEKENSVILLEENFEMNYKGFNPNDPSSYIMLSLYQDAFLNNSLLFAEMVQGEFRTRVNRTDRGVKQEPFLVISSVTMPSVLIELGFLTNPDEEDFLNSKQGQDYMASAIFRAFRGYKELIEKDTHNFAEKKQTSKIAPEMGQDVLFKVQVISSSEKLNIQGALFRSMENVSYYEDKGVYKYTIGSSEDFKAIKALQEELKSGKFKDAFVVAFQGNERIPITKAMSLVHK